MKKIILIAALISASLSAQESTTSSTFDLWNGLKKSPLGFSIVNEFATQSASNNTGINGFYNELTPYLSYKLTGKDSLRFNTSVIISDNYRAANELNADVAWGGATLRYKRSKILTEDKNWLNMSAEIRFNLDADFNNDESNKIGSTSFRTNLTRTIMAGLELNTELRYDEYLRKSSSAKLKRRKLAATINPSYVFAKDWYVLPSLAFKYEIQGETANKAYKKNKVTFAPEIGYQVMKDLAVAVYWEATPFKSHDGELFAKNWGKNAMLAAYLDYKFF
ncbi:MAG: hypothetical protein DRQ88_04265 [Epsilonproteobacteria bacterium]|nr:MAG: hypothetical protein DRQ89_00460 [Campylobacterota bacterium]RLA67115.1 MAG: hypothetical protein DRQ88_04265 [Campylobacterota bacterium]